MASVFDTEFLEARIAKLKTRLEKIDSAIEAVLGGAQSYSIDDGQTRRTVTRTTIGELRHLENQLLSQLQTLDARLNGGSYQARPGF